MFVPWEAVIPAFTKLLVLHWGLSQSELEVAIYTCLAGRPRTNINADVDVDVKRENMYGQVVFDVSIGRED